MRYKSTMFYCCFCLAALNLESFFPGWDALICGEQISAVCKIQGTKEVRQLCQQYIDGFTKDILGTILSGVEILLAIVKFSHWLH